MSLPGDQLLWPVADTLSRLEPFVAPALVSARAFKGIRQLAGRIPDVARNYYFEVRLGEDQGVVDFALCVGANDGRSSAEWRTQALYRFAERTPEWAALSPFLHKWAEPASQRERRWPALWLGFDAPETIVDRLPVPCISVPLNERLGQPRGRDEAADAASVIADGCAQFLDGAIESRQRSQLTQAFLCLPGGAQVMFFSVMLARSVRAIKLNVLIPVREVPAYLSAVGWQGSLADVASILSTWCRATDRVRLDLTLGELGYQRLGVELLSKKLPRSQQAAAQLAELLYVQNLCTAAQRQGLCQWWGHSSERYPSHGWSTCLARTWYAKLCWQSHSALQAKTYLGFLPQTFPPFLLEAQDCEQTRTEIRYR